MGLNALKKDRNIDIVFCIDATSSMGPCIENVRKNAKKFYQDFVNKMTNEYNSSVTDLRVQVVVFRDLECDTESLVKSEWFELPSDASMFENYLNRITPRGGGDYKESGIEGLYAAMTTDWIARHDGDRQVIVLFTDADAIDFTEKRNRTGYQNVCDEKEFYLAWACATGNRNKLQERGKRLIMFAPAGSKYQKIQSGLNRSQFVAVEPQKGMADVKFEDILKMICASACAI